MHEWPFGTNVPWEWTQSTEPKKKNKENTRINFVANVSNCFTHNVSFLFVMIQAEGIVRKDKEK